MIRDGSGDFFDVIRVEHFDGRVRPESAKIPIKTDDRQITLFGCSVTPANHPPLASKTFSFKVRTRPQPLSVLAPRSQEALRQFLFVR
jgi:hypothetical protein